MLAHAGHVLFDLGVYGSPVAVLVGGLCFSTARARREDEEEAARERADRPALTP